MPPTPQNHPWTRQVEVTLPKLNRILESMPLRGSSREHQLLEAEEEYSSRLASLQHIKTKPVSNLLNEWHKRQHYVCTNELHLRDQKTLKLYPRCVCNNFLRKRSLTCIITRVLRNYWSVKGSGFLSRQTYACPQLQGVSLGKITRLNINLNFLIWKRW